MISLKTISCLRSSVSWSPRTLTDETGPHENWLIFATCDQRACKREIREPEDMIARKLWMWSRELDKFRESEWQELSKSGLERSERINVES